jgi:stage V sporulation protein M
LGLQERLALLQPFFVCGESRREKASNRGLRVPAEKPDDLGTFSPWENIHVVTGQSKRAGGLAMKFYTIRLPRFLGGLVKAVLNTFSKN